MAQPEKITVERESTPTGTYTVLITSRGGVHAEKVISVSGLSRQQVDAYFECVEYMALAFTAQLKARPEDKITDIASMLLPAKPAPPSILREARMLARAKSRTLNSGDWLTAQDIAELAQFSSVNASSQPNKWKRAGKIFAIRHSGKDYFPAYGLDPQQSYRPHISLAPVITVLAQIMDGWGMAFWFGSSNSYLKGRKPKEVLMANPEDVLKAAQNEIYGALHG